VATGSIKAHDAEMVAGTISNSGLMDKLKAVAARIGIKSVAIAVFDVTSVRKVINKHTVNIIKMVGKFDISTRRVPNHSAKPEVRKPFANAIPPPNSSKMPHGIFTADSQSNRY